MITNLKCQSNKNTCQHGKYGEILLSFLIISETIFSAAVERKRSPRIQQHHETFTAYLKNGKYDTNNTYDFDFEVLVFFVSSGGCQS